MHIIEQNHTIQIVSKLGIKGPDKLINLVWANTCISVYAIHNPEGVANVIRNL